MEESKKNKLNRTLIAALVVLIVFILPAGSWFYLQSGLDYHKKSKAELKDFGKVAEYTAINQNNLPVSPEGLEGRVTVVHFLPANPSAAKLLADRVAKVHQSFDETEDVVFLTFIPTDSTSNLPGLARNLGITDNSQWYLAGVSQQEWNRLATEVYKITQPEKQVVLVDMELSIRNYYDINDNPAMGRLVEHIALVMPKQKRR